MSAMNCFVSEKAIHLFTDGAKYDTEANFEMKGLMSKTLALPHYHAVIAATGIGWATTMICVEITQTEVEGFDDLVAQFADIVRSAATKADAIAAMPSIGTTNVILAGWSERNGLSAYALWTAEMDGVEPYHLARINDFRSPTNDYNIDRLAFAEDNAAVDGLALMQSQPRELVILRDGSGRCGYRVGGFCQHTVIDGQGIHMRGLPRWDDVVGEPVEAPRAP